MATKRKPRKPAPQEQIYSSVTGNEEKIRTNQKIAELLAKYRAEWLGITELGDRFWEIPDLKDFYSNQWADISNAIRRYGGRNVISGIEMNRWICNPKYGNNPLRLRLFTEKMKAMLSVNIIKEPEKELPKQHIPAERKKREY